MEILASMPSLQDAGEILALNAENDPDSREKRYLTAIEELSYLLSNAVIGYCYYDERFTTEEKIAIILHMNGIFSLLERDFHCGKNRVQLIYNYHHLGNLYAQLHDYDRAIEYYCEAAEGAKKFSVAAEKFLRFYERGDMFRNLGLRERLKLLMTKYDHPDETLAAMPKYRQIITDL